MTCLLHVRLKAFLRVKRAEIKRMLSQAKELTGFILFFILSNFPINFQSFIGVAFSQLPSIVWMGPFATKTLF